MDQGNDVQDQNLVNDQVTQALNDSGATDAPAADTPAPDAPPAEDAAAEAPATSDAEATPLDTPTVSAPLIDPPVSEDTPAEEEPAIPTITDTPGALSPAPAPAASNGADDDLMSVKQKALEQLSPLVDHLDLPADQKFDTYMEILRASDDKSLVQPAFDAAQKIESEDKRAQALLDVVNEVNYLTQDHAAKE